MSKNRASLNWQVLEYDGWGTVGHLVTATSETGTTAEQKEPPRHRRWVCSHLLVPRNWKAWLFGLAMVILLVVTATGYRLWQDAYTGIRQIQADIQDRIGLEAWVWQNSGPGAASNLLDDQAPVGWKRSLLQDQAQVRLWAGGDFQAPVAKIQEMELRGDLALVIVLMTQSGVPWVAGPYQETRFYRWVEGTWLRTSPQAEFWGRSATLETAHFRFAFRQRDAQAVETVAAEIEAIYAALRQDFGLEMAPADEKLDIEVKPVVIPRVYLGFLQFVEDRLVVPSPDLLQVPEGLSHAAALRHTLVVPLARRVMEEAIQRAPVKTTWQPLTYGLRLWLEWQGGYLPAAGKPDLGSPLPRWPLENPALRSGDLMAIATHPSEQEYQWRQWVRQWLGDNPQLRLVDATASPWDYSARYASAAWWEKRVVIAETVVAYVTATYGSERLPVLLQGFRQHDTWETLIPAVYGVQASDFEEGWRRYLAEHTLP